MTISVEILGADISKCSLNEIFMEVTGPNRMNRIETNLAILDNAYYSLQYADSFIYSLICGGVKERKVYRLWDSITSDAEPVVLVVDCSGASDGEITNVLIWVRSLANTILSLTSWIRGFRSTVPTFNINEDRYTVQRPS